MPRKRKRKEVVAESDAAPPPDAQLLQLPSTLSHSPTLTGRAALPSHGRVTRQSVAKLKQCPISTSPMRSPLQSLSTPSQHSIGTRRVLLEANEKPCPESPRLQASENLTKNEVPTSPVMSLSYSSPRAEGDHCGRNDLSAANITPKLPCQTEIRQGFQPIVQSQEISPVREANLALNATTEVQKIVTSHSKKCIQSSSTSLGMTAMADMCKDAMDDDEAESTYFPAMETVKGYRVKEEVAALLRNIFAKYGDIAQDSVLKSSESRSHFLEMVCHIYENLKNSILEKITLAELDAMLHNVDDLESMKLNVGWLRMKLTEIKEVKELLRDYAHHKEEKAEIARKETALEVFEADLFIRRQKFLLLKEELAAMKGKHEERTQKFLQKGKVKALFENGLVDGLL